MLHEQSHLESVTSEEWREIYLKLRLHTWGRYGGLRERGFDLDDVVHEAISDTIQGTRRWPPVDHKGENRTDVSLFSFLCNVVRSKVSHLWAQQSRNVSSGLIEQDREALETAMEELPFVSLEHWSLQYSRKNPTSANVVGADSQAIYNELSHRVLELVAGDAMLMRIVELWVEDPSLKPQEVAARLGLSLSEMRVAQKRLKRRLQKVRTKE